MNISDYWKMEDEYGLYHVYDNSAGIRSLCGMCTKPVNRPGTIGREKPVTCLACMVTFERISGNQAQVWSTSRSTTTEATTSSWLLTRITAGSR